MKYYVRSNAYKASNVEYNCDTETAYSYGWWRFVQRINGKLVFNNYSYSPSTIKHQYKVRHLLDELGKQIDLVVSAPDGLQNLSSAIEYEREEIRQLIKQIRKPRSHKAKNEERKREINQRLLLIKEIKQLLNRSG